MSTELKNKVYIVTSGSKGFGLAIAKCLVEVRPNRPMKKI